MAEVVQHLRVHDRVACQQLVVGRRQSVAGQVTDEVVEELCLIGRQAHAGGRRDHTGEQRIGWDAGDVLGNVPVAAAYGQVRLRRGQCGVTSDVDAGVAAAHDQNAPAAELLRIRVRGRVADLAPEWSMPSYVGTFGCQFTPGAAMIPAYRRVSPGGQRDLPRLGQSARRFDRDGGGDSGVERH